MNRPPPDAVKASARRPQKLRDRRRVSAMLRELVDNHTEARISVRQIRDGFGLRAYGALLFVFSMFNLIPLPPGLGFVFAFPVLWVAAQLVWGAKHPYIPRWLGERSFAVEDFRATVEKLLPLVERAERLLRPRLIQLTFGVAERLVGVVCLVLAIVLFLPIPVAGNWPPALAICVLSLALIERDGVAVLLGATVAAVSVFVTWGVIYAASKAALTMASRLFGA